MPLVTLPLQHFPRLSDVAATLTAIRQGKDAEHLGGHGDLDTLSSAERIAHQPSSLVALPMFVRDTNVRIHWDRRHLSRTSDDALELHWSVDDRGVGEHHGSVTVRGTGEYPLFDGADADIIVTRCSTPRLLSARLSRVREAGDAALLTLVPGLEAWLLWQAKRVCASIATEFGHEPDYNRILDEVGRQTVVDTLMWGGEGELDSRAIRRLRACAMVDRSSAGDPRQWLARNLRRDLDELIRRSIGDPIRGGTIRQAARDLRVELDRDPTDGEIAAHLRETRPSDKIGVARVRAALAVAVGRAPTSMAMHHFEDAA